MRKAFRHTGVLMMLAVVALGLVGAAYTLWFENLSLNVTANTGTFNADVSFANWTVSGYGADQNSGTGSGQPVVGVYPAGHFCDSTRSAQGAMTKPANCNYLGYDGFNYANWIFNGVDKLAASGVQCNIAIGTTGTNGVDSNDTVSNNLLTLNMVHLFPYAGCEYKVDIHNSGTVPMHLTAGPLGVYQKCPIGVAPNGTGCVNLTQQSPALSFATAGQDPNHTPDANDLMCAAILGTHPGHLVVDSSSKPIQIEPGGNVDCTFKVILDEVAGGENSTFYVTWNWTAHQWNEPASMLPNFPDQH